MNQCENGGISLTHTSEILEGLEHLGMHPPGYFKETAGKNMEWTTQWEAEKDEN